MFTKFVSFFSVSILSLAIPTKAIASYPPDITNREARAILFGEMGAANSLGSIRRGSTEVVTHYYVKPVDAFRYGFRAYYYKHETHPGRGNGGAPYLSRSEIMFACGTTFETSMIKTLSIHQLEYPDGRSGRGTYPGAESVEYFADDSLEVATYSSDESFIPMNQLPVSTDDGLARLRLYNTLCVQTQIHPSGSSPYQG